MTLSYTVVQIKPSIDLRNDTGGQPCIVTAMLAYCASCHPCKVNASVQKRPEGGMSGHSIPDGRWEVVHMDWITDLPMTAKGHDAILVVHDKITKYAYFIPACSSDTAEITANKLFAQVFCLHGLPLQIVSDRDKLFTAKFFAQLMRILNVKQVVGTSYQHDFNGAAERLNRTVEVMLRHVVGDHVDRDFDDFLPLIQWSYNTTKHDSIKMSPFFAQWGYEPRQSLILPNIPEPLPNQHISLQSYVEHQQQVLTQVREALLEAKFIMELYKNKQRTNPQPISVGDKVYLSTKNIGASHLVSVNKKLKKRFIGPFAVLEKCSEYTFRLDLPKTMSRMHPVFHVALLWKEVPTPADLANRFKEEPLPGANNIAAAEVNTTIPPQQPELGVPSNDEEFYQVEKILSREKSGRSFRYLVKWQGYPDSDNSFVIRSDFVGKDAKKMVADFDRECNVKTRRGKADIVEVDLGDLDMNMDR